MRFQIDFFLKITMKPTLKTAYIFALILIAMTAVLAKSATTRTRNVFMEFEELDDETLISRAKSHYSKNMMDSALRCFSIVAARHNEKSSEEERMRSAHAYNDCGIIYFMLGNYPRAYNSFVNAKRLGNDEMRIMIDNNIASIYHYFNDKPRALEYLYKAFDGASKIKNWDAFLSSGLNILNSCYDNDDKEQTDRIPDIAARIKESKAPDDNFKKYVNLTAEGMTSVLKGDTLRGLSLFRKAMETSAKILDSQRYRISSINNLVRTFMNCGRQDSAIYYIKQSLAIAEELNQIESMMTDYEMLSNYYAAMGDHENELKYRLMHLNIKDSIFSTKEYGKILDFQSACDIDNMEKKLLESEYKRRTRETIIWLSIALLAVAIGSAIWIYTQNKKLRASLEVLYEKAKSMTYADNQSESRKSTKETENIEEEQNPKQLLETEAAEKLRTRIIEAMQQQQDWKSPEFSLQELCRSVDSNSKYVSYVLNRIIGKTFSEFASEYRVLEACRMLSDKKNANMTIETIGQSVGFKSRSTFGAAFKKITGLSPKDYLAMAREDHSRG